MQDEKLIFVLMPFKDEYDDVYLVIRDAVSAASQQLKTMIACRRADEISSPGRITEQILASIRKAHLLIADVTGSNPNVMYELGFAHASDKSTVILNQEIHETPFDVKDFRQILYDRTRLMKDCRPRLVTAICDVLSQNTVELDEGPAVPRSQKEANTSIPVPLRPGAKVVAMLQTLELRLQLANKSGSEAERRAIGKDVRELLDRVTVATGGDTDDLQNTAAVIGNCAVELEKAELFEEAEDIYRRAIGLAPDYPGLHLQYGDYLIDMGRKPEARAELDRAKLLGADPDRLARLETKLAFAEGAVPEKLAMKLRSAFEANPGNRVAAAGYLMFLQRNNDLAEFERACKAWEGAVSPPQRQEPRRALADMFASQDDQESRRRAVEIYESLLTAAKGEFRHDVLHNVATLYALMGDNGLAKERWTEAYSMEPSDDVVRAAFSQRPANWGELELAIKVSAGSALI